MWVIIVPMVLFGLAVLSLGYYKGRFEIELWENDHVQGVKLDIQLPLYRIQLNYDYSDPKLHLWEAVLIDRINNGLKAKLGFNLAAFKNILRRIPHLFQVSDYEQFSFHVFKKALGFTVVENLEWRTTVGGRDAMQTALGAGFLWALKAWIVAYISSQAKLEQLHLAVNPDFAKDRFTSKISCILKMRIVHIITIAICILVLKVRWWMNGITARAIEQPSH